MNLIKNPDLLDRLASSYAISLEPKGGVPGAGGPTGPVLFSGTLIKKML